MTDRDSGVKRAYNTENGSVYVEFLDDSWEYKKNGEAEVHKLRCAVYVSEERYLDMVSRYNLIKNNGNPNNESLDDLINYGEKEGYRDDNGGIFGIKPKGGMRRSSRVLKIKPPFEEVLLVVEE